MIGSPKPEPTVSQGPPNPAQMDAMLVGPRIDRPVYLSKTWKVPVTTWTYWVAPTSPLRFGGMQVHADPAKGIPSKLNMGGGITSGSSVPSNP